MVTIQNFVYHQIIIENLGIYCCVYTFNRMKNSNMGFVTV